MIENFQKIKKIKVLVYLILGLVSLLLFTKVEAANDLIGIRVYSNINHWSPSKWYLERVPYPGNPQLAQIDGYEAVIDGRTTYVAAANWNGSTTYYTNIYVISYNENAAEEAVNIYNQLIDNWYFNTNIADELIKEKVTRDTKRLADLQGIAELINTYGEEHRYCSVSGNIQCQDDDDCPAGQTCLDPVYPALSSGSYVQGQSTSKWPSWQQTLATALATSNLSVDPTNEFTGCTESPEPPGSGYNSNTCWNEVLNSFSCVDDSKFYIYNTENPNDYELAADAEIFTQTNLNNYNTLADSTNIAGLINGLPMCTATGLGAYCGNGIVNPGEVCEPGMSRNYCDQECSPQNWHQERILGCTSSCQWFEPYPPNPPGPTSAQCTDFCGGYCGDNQLQGIWEECDGSQFLPGWSCTGGGNLECDNCQLTCDNGQPPYTGECGNGIPEYPEQCDYLNFVAPTPQYSSQSWQYQCTTGCLDDGGWCGDNNCQSGFGEDPTTCAIDCVAEPSAPTNFNATAFSTTQINLSWNDVSDENGYKIWRSTAGFPDGGGVLIADLPANSTSYNNTGLSANTHYYYKLVAYNDGGDSSAVFADATTLSPGPAPATIFVSSQTFNGNLVNYGQVNYNPNIADGLDTADRICNDLADNNSSLIKQGIWRAWLSSDNTTGNNAAGSRLVNSGAYLLPNNIGTVASNLNDLRDGTLALPINQNESGNPVTNQLVWTGTNANGTAIINNTCTNWQTTTGSGYYGGSSSTNSYWTAADDTICSSLNRIYCLYQGTTNQWWPVAPTITLSNITSNSIQVNWTGYLSTPAQTGFEVWRSTDNLNWTNVSGTLAGIVTFYENTGLTPSQIYYYKVRAIKNISGQIYYSYFSNVDSAFTGQLATVFVSSQPYTGNLGGTAGADQKCTDLASASPYVQPGSWVAWVSTNQPGGNAYARFTFIDPNIRELILPGGVNIGYYSQTLLGYAVVVPVNNIDVDENSISQPGVDVWTNANEEGQFISPGEDCFDWTGDINTIIGKIGSTSGYPYWSYNPNLPYINTYDYCNTPNRLYCFFDTP